jgi:hypothetical protein
MTAPAQKFFASFFQKRSPFFRVFVRLQRHPVLFGLAAMLLHLCAVLPMLARHHFDTSMLIVAGDRFVTAGQTPSPIIILHDSDGYDGQFYYRLALAPITSTETAFGITLDHPAWRMQRIMLPLLARLVAGGQARAVPASLLVINLAGIFCLGWLAMRIARSRQWSLAIPLAIAAWPGLLIALTHDTTEILAAALLLGGIATWTERRFAIAALLFAAATLTRETSVLVITGLLLSAGWRMARPRHAPRPWHEAGWSAAALVPFLGWRQYVTSLWRDAPQRHGVAHNAGWPLLGVIQTTVANLLGRAIGLAHQPRNLISRITALLSVIVLTWFCVRTARACVQLLRSPAHGGLAAGWLLVLALMTTLTANGPWVEPTAYFRAFTECWVLGWVMLGIAGRTPRYTGWLLAAGIPLVARNLMLCWIQTKG